MVVEYVVIVSTHRYELLRFGIGLRYRSNRGLRGQRTSSCRSALYDRVEGSIVCCLPEGRRSHLLRVL